MFGIKYGLAMCRIHPLGKYIGCGECDVCDEGFDMPDVGHIEDFYAGAREAAAVREE